MSLFKSLFGRRSPSDEGTPPAAGKSVKQIEYGDFVIHAAPFRAAGQFQTAGFIEKTIAGTRKEHRFIRADRFGSLDEAADFALGKGRQIVDEQGDRMFG
jgi:hypothetical protein